MILLHLKIISSANKNVDLSRICFFDFSLQFRPAINLKTQIFRIMN